MRPKLLAGSLLLGAGITALLVYTAQTPGRHWFDPLLWVGYLAGSFVSGNVHSPNEAVAWFTICLGLAAPVYGAALLVDSLNSRRSRRIQSSRGHS